MDPKRLAMGDVADEKHGAEPGADPAHQNEIARLRGQNADLLGALKTLVREYMTATDTGPCMWCGGTPPKHINASSCPFANAEAAIEAAS
jgi:hypothetical protein